MVKKQEIISKLKTLNNQIEYVFPYKYSGVSIQILSFHTYLKNIVKLVSHKIFLLHKTSCYITEAAAVKNYKSGTLIYMDYGDILFINIGNCKPFRRALRI